MHNYGVAVDLTIEDEKGQPLDMGVGFDFFGIEAHTDVEDQLVAEGKLTPQQVANRQFLREVMGMQNFQVLSNEWWHFNGYSLEEAKQKFKLLDF